MPRPSFILAGGRLINEASVRWVDISDIERLRIVVHHDDGADVIERIQAIEALMTLKPSAFESKRLRWARHAWAIHNLIGHPLMQVLAFFRLYRHAMHVHDVTVPRPKMKTPSLSREGAGGES
jgi:hypothetical protein